MLFISVINKKKEQIFMKKPKNKHFIWKQVQFPKKNVVKVFKTVKQETPNNNNKKINLHKKFSQI